jgi:hypothetical protein
MMAPDDILEERLDRLAAGAALGSCLADLPAEEALLLKRAALLMATPEAGPTPERVAAGRRALLDLVEVHHAPTSTVATLPANSWDPGPAAAVVADPAGTATRRSGRTGRLPRELLPTRPRWAMPLLLSGGALALVVLMALVALRPASSGTTLARVAPPNPATGALNELQGVIELQAADGTWAPTAAGTLVTAGQRLRTRALTQVVLDFFDGSQARLGPETEVSLDQLNARKAGARLVVLTQWVGESDHEVAPSSDPASQYTVNTPAGGGTAKGTVFHVRVTANQVSRFDVREGVVAVIGSGVTVLVVAGQSTLIVAGQPPQSPVFLASGEGAVEQLADSHWQIAGRTLVQDENTIIVDQPRVGDQVAFAARLLLDGSWILDRLTLLARSPTSRFTLEGSADLIEDGAWTIAGRSVGVAETTRIDPGLAVGTLVEVDGDIGPDGALRATGIRRLAVGNDAPFAFTGVVEHINGTAWAVSGLSVTVAEATQVELGLGVGNVVLVRGEALADGSWLASSIQPAAASEHEFVLVAPVRHRDPWQVASLAIQTNPRTELDDGIQLGERVRITGRIAADGRWVADAIQRLGHDGRPRFAFTGWVTGTSPWHIAGIPVVVDSNTDLAAALVSGVLVRVWGRIQPDGTWLAQKVVRLDRGRGCFNYSSAVRTVQASQLVLFDGAELALDRDVQILGELQPATVVVVSGCVPEDGSFQLVTIVVVGQLELVPERPPTSAAEPILPQPAAPLEPAPAGGLIEIRQNNQAITLNCLGKLVSVRGNKNTILLLGSCAGVTVWGNKNTITLESATAITNRGNNNVILQR